MTRCVFLAGAYSAGGAYNLVLVRGTEKSKDDGRRSERDCVAGWTMLPRYAGQRPVTTACIKQHSLNWTRQRMGSQCNWRRLGVMCSDGLSSNISRAAAFCAVIQQQFWMKECDILWGQNTCWRLRHIFRGSTPRPQTPSIYAPAMMTMMLKWRENVSL